MTSFTPLIQVPYILKTWDNKFSLALNNFGRASSVTIAVLKLYTKMELFSLKKKKQNRQTNKQNLGMRGGKRKQEIPGNLKSYFLWEAKIYICPVLKGEHLLNFFQSISHILKYIVLWACVKLYHYIYFILQSPSESMSKFLFDMCSSINPLITAEWVIVYSFFGVLAFQRSLSLHLCPASSIRILGNENPEARKGRGMGE